MADTVGARGTGRKYRRPVEVGDLVGKAMGIWLNNLIPFFLIALVVNVPVFALTYAVERSSPEPQIVVDEYGRARVEQDTTNQRIVSVVSLLLGQVVTGAVTYGVVQELRKKRAGFGACIAVGFQRMLPVLGVALLAILCMGIWFVPAFLVIRSAPALILLAFLFALITAVVLCVAVPAAVIERPGVFGALARSAELTKGSRWTIFFAFFILLILVGLLQFVAGLAVGLVLKNSPTALLIGATALGVLFTPVIPVAQAVVYHDLRRAKEGVGIVDVAKVFE